MFDRHRFLFQRLPLFIFIFFSFSYNLFSQQTPTPTPQNKKTPQRVIRKSGWAIPGRESYSNNFNFVANIKVDGVDVRYREHILLTERRPLFELESYEIKNDKLTISVILTNVSSLSSLELNGKVFAYGVDLGVTDTDLRGFRTYIAAKHAVAYYDEDGDGIFESMIPTMHLPNPNSLNIQTKLIKSITRINGWDTPGPSVSNKNIGLVTIDGVRLMKSSSEESNGQYNINDGSLYNIETYSSGEEGQIVINNTLCVVRQVFFYEAEADVDNEFDERFAQEVYLQPVAVDENGMRKENGKPFVQFYCDDFKNSVSETRYDGETTLHLPLKLIVELKKRKKSKPKKHS